MWAAAVVHASHHARHTMHGTTTVLDGPWGSVARGGPVQRTSFFVGSTQPDPARPSLTQRPPTPPQARTLKHLRKIYYTYKTGKG